MQVKTNKLIKDKESVELGISKIVTKYSELIEKYKVEKVEKEQERNERKHKLYVESGIVLPETSFQYEVSDWEFSNEIIKDYNPDYTYITEVRELSDIIMKKYYPNSKIKLNE